MSLRHALAVTALTLGGLLAPVQVTASGEPPEPTPPPNESVVDNEFYPEKKNVGECISAVEKPSCGSDARGGWRQTLLFGLLVAVLGLGGWRLVVAIRRRDEAVLAAAKGDEGSATAGSGGT